MTATLAARTYTVSDEALAHARAARLADDEGRLRARDIRLGVFARLTGCPPDQAGQLASLVA